MVAVFIVRAGVDSWNQTARPGRHIPAFSWIVLCAGLYLLSLLPEGVFWRKALVDLGQNVSWTNSLAAYYIGHLGKYVPGKAMVIAFALVDSYAANLQRFRSTAA